VGPHLAVARAAEAGARAAVWWSHQRTTPPNTATEAAQVPASLWSSRNPAVIHLQQVPAPFWQLTGALIAAIELTRARLGWEPPVEGLFTLREQYTPGNLQFDPLGLRSLFKDGLTGARAAELQWGRLAMLASVFIVSEEAAFGRTALWF